MTEVMYRQFVVTECPRCPDLVLSGVVAGIRFRVDRRTISPEHAAVVKHYGVPVMVLDRRPSGWHAEFWEPEHDLSRPNRWLVVPHVCHCGHANQLVGRPALPAPAPVTDDRPPY